MQLELKQLTLSNFKGIKYKKIDFNHETWIYGANGSGKTSLFDSFVWCLFGKDHLGRLNYELKPYDANGITIPRADVSVEAVILVDGEQKVLRRVYQEDWVKPRTEVVEVLKGHNTIYYINDIVVKKSEYDAFVSGLCDEVVFKSITNPAYFPNLEKDKQQALLFSFVQLTDDEIAGDNEDYKSLLKELTGVNHETFKKDISNKKTRIRTELNGLPERIKGLHEGMPEIPNEAEITAELESKQSQVDEIETKLNDVAQNMNLQNQQRMEIQSEINKAALRCQEIQQEHTSSIILEINKKQQTIREIESNINESTRKQKERELKVSQLNAEKENKQALLETLRSQWKEINTEEIEFPEGAFTCPSCKRLLEVSDIETKQKELTENFNKDKAEKLLKNKNTGLGVAQRLKDIDVELAALAEPEKTEMFAGTRIKALQSEISELEQKKNHFTSNKEYIELQVKINGCRMNLESIPNVADNTELIAKKKELVSEIDKLKAKLTVKDIVANTKNLIADHERRMQALNQEFADLEKKEYLLKQFEFAKNTEYEKRINQLFRFVKFRLFHTQVDGQVVPDFECMVDGVPYSTLNNAMQICAGLDIINTISEKREVWAPIWLDNRESVTKIPEMKTQIINLVVEPSQGDLFVQN